MSLSLDQTPVSESGARRILIVDDEPTLRFGFAYALTENGTVPDTASNGAEALERLEATSYDAVVLDLRMPEVDGLAVIQKMRSRGDMTPVILCSAFINLHSALIAIQNQVVDFLMKPVKPADLRKAVSGVLGNDTTCLGKALSAMRRNQPEEAIRILEKCEPDDAGSETAWLKVLVTMRDNGFVADEAESGLNDPLIELMVVRGAS